ncbi:hypothetical protein BPAE_0173g00150 [Botrytis paeoniae]|uniref:Uncharacterized protein n=1 Tax=Botrytis paeoniae TaxID=278948 RepID=A0A4Z1FCS6_9HELO|nr:hypothetical protein BPAE_0173g00150 [Botrytis paeoniae]
MGIAILSAILSCLNTPQTPISIPPTTSGTSTPAYPTEPPTRLPSKFIACVRRPKSAKKVLQTLYSYFPTSSITILQNENVLAVQRASIILLASKPYTYPRRCNRRTTPNRALRRTNKRSHRRASASNPCTIVRAMPNTASQIRESMTVISTSTPPLPESMTALLTLIFTRISEVVFLPPSTMMPVLFSVVPVRHFSH